MSFPRALPLSIRHAFGGPENGDHVIAYAQFRQRAMKHAPEEVRQAMRKAIIAGTELLDLLQERRNAEGDDPPRWATPEFQHEVRRRALWLCVELDGMLPAAEMLVDKFAVHVSGLSSEAGTTLGRRNFQLTTDALLACRIEIQMLRNLQDEARR